MISFELVGSDHGHTNPCAGSDSGSSRDQQRRMGRRLPGGSPAQNKRAPTTGAATAATYGVTGGKAVISALRAGDTVLFKTVNISSRHGPHSAAAVALIVASDSKVGDAMHSQNPGSSFAIPSAEMQTEPLASGGRTTSS